MSDKITLTPDTLAPYVDLDDPVAEVILARLDKYNAAMAVVSEESEGADDAFNDAMTTFKDSDRYAEFYAPKFAEIEAKMDELKNAKKLVDNALRNELDVPVVEDPNVARTAARNAHDGLIKALNLAVVNPNKTFMLPKVRLIGGGDTDPKSDFFLDSKGAQHLKKDVRAWGIKRGLCAERGAISAKTYDAFEEAYYA